MPHGYCYLWNHELIALHSIADLLVALAYCLIPMALWGLRKRVKSDLLAWFALFIFSCGMTHVMNVWVIWHPDYVVELAVKGLTAISSLMTAALLFRFAKMVRTQYPNA